MFIKQTRLIRPGLPDVAIPGIKRTKDELAEALPLAERAAFLLSDNFDVAYDLRCVYEVRLLGTIEPFGHIFMEYDVWVSQASKDAGDPPVYSNSHIIAMSTKAGADHPAWIQTNIEAVIRNKSIQGFRPNERDTRFKVGDADPSRRITAVPPASRAFRRAEVQALNGRVIERT